MRTIIEKLVIILLFLVVLFSCNRKEVLDDQRDYALIRAINSSKNQTDKDIDIEALEKHALAYEKNKEKGKYCLANTLIG
jgi:hypothetical protein